MGVVGIAVISLLFLFVTFYAPRSSQAISIQSGILDLREWQFSKDENIKLDGEWGFYWKKFLTYEDLQKEKPDLYVTVPNNWRDYTMQNKPLPSEGFATYTLHVNTNLAPGTQLGLMLNKFSSAYRIYISDVLVAANGEAAITSRNEIGEYKPQSVTFNIPEKEFDIIIHVSNYQFAKGGFLKSITLGHSEDILNKQYFKTGKEVFLQGMLIIIAILFFAIYVFQREFKYSLYFACMTVAGMVALDMVSDIVVSRMFPGLSLKYIILIWYSSSHWVVFFLILYFNEIFKTVFSKYVVRISFVIYSVIQAVYLTTEPIFYSQYANLLNFIDITFFICVLINIAIGIKGKERDSWIHGGSLLIFVTAYVYDILYWGHLIHHRFGEMIYIGSFTFHFIQIVIQARRIKFYFEDKQAAELAFLQSQIKPHFLFNTLNTFIAISRNNLGKAHQLLYDLTNYLRSQFNIHTLSEFVILEEELNTVKLYLNIQQARFENKFEVYFNVPNHLLHTKIPILMLQPIVENALIHGILPKDTNGVITITVEDDSKYLYFTVEDNGVGVSSQSKSTPTNGIALSNIHSRLVKLYKKGLIIESVIGESTRVSWIIPKKSCK